MNNKKLLLTGGAGILGIVLLYFILRGHSNAAQASANTPESIQSYPSSNFQPAPINIQEAPLQLVYNQPATRNLTPQQQMAPKETGCCSDCNNTPVSDQLPGMSDKLLASMVGNLRSFGKSFVGN